MLTSIIFGGDEILDLPGISAQPGTSRASEVALPGRKQCIIIIEDNPGDVFIMEEALVEHDVRCDFTVLSDGDLAAAYFDRIDGDQTVECPTVVLLDLNLPKRNGHSVLRRIRQGRCRTVPVVIVSSSEAPADLEQNRQLGATAYFKKSSSLEQFMKLGALVKSLLRRGSTAG